MALDKEPVCDLCEGHESHPWRLAYGPGGKRYTLRRCASCSLMFLYPQPSSDMVVDYYSDGEGATFHPLARAPQIRSLRDRVRTEIDRQIYFSGRIPASTSYLVRALGRIASRGSRG